MYDELGYGFLEAVYASALAHEFSARSILFRREAHADVFYKAKKSGLYRADFIVADRIVVEVKATERICDADKRQVLNYLRATRLELGLLLHFGPKPGFKRMIFENSRKRSIAG